MPSPPDGCLPPVHVLLAAVQSSRTDERDVRVCSITFSRVGHVDRMCTSWITRSKPLHRSFGFESLPYRARRLPFSVFTVAFIGHARTKYALARSYHSSKPIHHNNPYLLLRQETALLWLSLSFQRPSLDFVA
jgi:hypothetical protein